MIIANPPTNRPDASPASIAARLDRLPPSRFLRTLIVWCALAGFFECYDVFMTSYIGVGLIGAKLFHAVTPGVFSVDAFASFISAEFAGMFLGTLAFGGVSDRYGRRTAFVVSLLSYSLATLCMAFAGDALWIDVFRLLAGIGIGVQLITMSAYVTELSPRESRGGFLQLAKMIAFCAVPFVAIVARLTVPHTILGLAGWRYVAMIGGLGIPFALLLWRNLPESPRWLAAHGHAEEAERIVARLENAARSELGRNLPEPASSQADAPEPSATWSEMIRGVYLGRTVMLSAMNLLLAIGFYGFVSWVSELLLSEGISATRSLTYVLVIAFLNPIGPLLAMRFADRCERKWQIVLLGVVLAASELLWAKQHGALGILSLGALVTLVNAAGAALLHAYQTELYPTRMRGKAVGFVYCWGRLSNIFVGFGIAAVLGAWGVMGVAGILAGANASVALLVALFGPSTHGRSLEEISPVDL